MNQICCPYTTSKKSYEQIWSLWGLLESILNSVMWCSCEKSNLVNAKFLQQNKETSGSTCKPPFCTCQWRVVALWTGMEPPVASSKYHSATNQHPVGHHPQTSSASKETGVPTTKHQHVNVVNCRYRTFHLNLFQIKVHAGEPLLRSGGMGSGESKAKLRDVWLIWLRTC